MREFIDVTGKSEDEAIHNALAQLNMDRDDVSVEVLERAKSGFLGLGSCPAKVRVYYGPEEEEEIVLSVKPEPKREEKPAPRQQQPR
ncbi:MAG: protein jag, partial [Oscillibacter sp.]|nr:protein jag [Oscillibacter sp.]